MDLNEIKKEIKSWETSFYNQHQRLPSSIDLRNAPDEIKAKYKFYKNEKQKRLMEEKNFNDISKIRSPKVIENKNNKKNTIIKESLLSSNNAKENIFNKQAVMNDPWKIRIDKTIIERKSNKENDSVEERFLKNLKMMRKEKVEVKINSNINENINNDVILPIPKNLIVPHENISDISQNKKETLPKRNVSILKNSFLKKSSAINLDSLITSVSNKDSKLDSPWEKEYADNALKIESKIIETIKLKKDNKIINCSKEKKEKEADSDLLHDNSCSETISEPMAKKRKVDTSSLSSNFVKLNMKKKIFGGKVVSARKAGRTSAKHTSWKDRRNGVRKCYNCGEEGHYSNMCSKRPKYGPRDEKAEVKALGFNNIDGVVTVADFRLQNIDTVSKLFNRPSYFAEESVQELIISSLDNDDLEECLTKSLNIFGFSSFKLNQEKVIRRICSGKSTLAVMPTGSGKSLCYQIPAYIFHQIKGSVALIISPLISLMQDQISKLPPGVKGVALNSTLKYKDKMKILEDINKLEYSFVLISPEALVESNWLSPERLPPISFVCIDEVHCLSDWSHHFRPSYLRVCKLLREKYMVNCILGLSATCTSDTIDNIIKYLKLDKTLDPECCVRNVPIPDNITISVSESNNKEYSLISLLKQPHISTSNSILIYCSTREETAEIATLVSVKLQNHQVIVGKKVLPWTVEAYHAGLTLPKRSILQRKFMKGKIRVLVATVAFGMGLDKSDLRTVIHFSRPRSYENYVQEVGRAGRDGLPSYAHVLMINKEHFKNGEDEELNDLHRHTYANHVEPLVLKQFIRTLFCTKQKCEKGFCHGHVQGINPSEMAINLNIREETLMTLLCYLELFEEIVSIKILPANYRYLKLNCYKGPKQMAEISQKSLALSTVLTMQYVNNDIDLINTKSIKLDMMEVWEKFGIEVAILRKELKSLEWNTIKDREENVKYFRSGVVNEFTEWNWVVAVRCDFDEETFDKIFTHLYERLNSLEKNTINDMEGLHNLLRSNHVPLTKLHFDGEDGDELNEKSMNIRNGILDYFNNENRKVIKEREMIEYTKSNELEVRNSVRAFIAQFKTDSTMSARAIASVFHGINSPSFPSIYWCGQKRFWRCALNVDFPTVMKWANEEMRFLM